MSNDNVNGNVRAILDKIRTLKRAAEKFWNQGYRTGCLSALSTLEGFIAGLPVVPPAPTWISVKERLPEDGQKVLVCGTRKGMQVGTFRGLVHPFDAMGWWWKKDTRLDVTHWMPLPELPEED